MTRLDKPLSSTQLEVLTWVEDRCPNGVYEDWTPRIVARALYGRGRALVKGRGAGWNVTLTADGAYYLEHREYLP